ncbi:membrane protein [Bacteroidia bacterium]|nr:membrane protein [Bacteroidia bacterium]
MKTLKFLFIIITAGVLVSCGEDFLTASSTTSKPYGSDSLTVASVNGNLAAAYHILLRDNYASGYNSVVFTSDLRSDDVFKGGGDAGDQKQFENLATYTCDPSLNLGGFWELYYRGVARCNETVANADKLIASGTENEGLVQQYKEEAIFLRAYYMYWIWLNWGNVPYPKQLLTAETDFVAKQYTAEEVYNFLMEDIAECEKIGKLGLISPEIGRTNLGAVYMLKAAIVMYQKDASKYGEVAANMAAIISSGNYGLMSDFDKMWLQEGEFCKENIFESNMGSGELDWGNSAGNPYGMGTNLPCYLSPRSLNDPLGQFESGWCFAPVRPYLYKTAGDAVAGDGKQPIFETADVRRQASVNYWSFADGQYSPGYQDTRGYFLRKYSARVGYSVAGEKSLNYANNQRIYRYAETLLNYAELVGVLGASASGGVTAQGCLDQVRSRAGVASITVNQDNIEQERHREFIGEGKRYWDLVRWGKAAQVLTEDFLQPSYSGDGSETTFTWKRTWTEKSKYLPIPKEEVDARLGSGLEIIQNPY